MCRRTECSGDIGTKLLLYAYGVSTYVTRYVVHLRNPKSCGDGVPCPRIHEVWHFPEDQRQTGLLAPSVNDWLKIKQESSGRPSWTSWDPEKENEYIRNYEEREGILFNMPKIAKNPGRKTTAKLMLNSFWGKFGEIMNMMKTVQCTQAHELLALLNNPLIDISTVCILSSEFLEVAYMRDDEETDKGTKTNILIASFTTCQARLKLYESLKVLGDRVLYYDTDSVIYTWKPGQSEIPLGGYLGDMTNGLDDGNHTTEFV